MGNGKARWEIEVVGTRAVTRRKKTKMTMTTLIPTRLVHEFSPLHLILPLHQSSHCNLVHARLHRIVSSDPWVT
jgi:acetate kinase